MEIVFTSDIIALYNGNITEVPIMSELKSQLQAINLSPDRSPKEVNEDIANILTKAGYSIVIEDYGRPWGGFNQLENSNADRFVEEFFPGLTPEEARLGNSKSKLSPKIITVAPEQRLSWQYHDRRAERWSYITKGGYFKSFTDEQGKKKDAIADEVVQFARGERHRLVGAKDQYTLVAEIWQHSDVDNLSNETDIIRLADDYKR
jgi:mannose-6-phosphate isomerase